MATVTRVLPWRRAAGRSASAEIAHLLEVYTSHHPKASTDLIERAFNLANTAHKGQNRKSGEPYIYCHGNVLPEALAGDCPLPAALRGADVARRSLWISSAGSCSPLHYDLPNVLLLPTSYLLTPTLLHSYTLL